METVASVFDNFTILLNSDIAKTRWENVVKTLSPGYELNQNWEYNKTLIYNYRLHDTHVLPLDVFMKEAVVVVPDNCALSTMLNSLISYLTCTIKSICPVSVANEMEFRLTIYMSPSNRDNLNLQTNKYLTKYVNLYNKGVLDEIFSFHMCRYEMVFKFDQNWNVLENKKPLGPELVHVGPCFRPLLHA